MKSFKFDNNTKFSDLVEGAFSESHPSWQDRPQVDDSPEKYSEHPSNFPLRALRTNGYKHVDTKYGTKVYRHPDGHEVHYSAEGNVTIKMGKEVPHHKAALILNALHG